MGDFFQRRFDESVTGQLFGTHGASPSSTRLVKDRTGTRPLTPQSTWGKQKEEGGGGRHEAEGWFFNTLWLGFLVNAVKPLITAN